MWPVSVSPFSSTSMITLGIALLLAVGLVAAKICQSFRLPSVTGYIVAGLLLGPTGFAIITTQSVGHNLDHFTQIALMLIAFGISEHIELKKLKSHSGSLLWIGIGETLGTFFLVSITVFMTTKLTGFTVEGWGLRQYIALSILLGSVGVATAPAATLLVVRELKAKGPLTSTLMAMVAIDNGLAIMIFGLMVSVAHQLIGQSAVPLYFSVISGVLEIAASLLLGIITGTCLIFVMARLKRPGEIMTAGLAVLLLCGELATYVNLSPLLAGMAAGFVLVNKAERDVRIFRAFNKFEPPIYVLFFTLAGTHLDIKTLGSAGIIGLIYFLSRISGKIIGVAFGARIARSSLQVRRFLGFALVPQAGVAIGLIFLLSSDPSLTVFATIITPVVLTGVFLSELIGPVSTRFALSKAGEAESTKSVSEPFSYHLGSIAGLNNKTEYLEPVHVVPWTWQKLKVPKTPNGVVAFSTSDNSTAGGLARMAAIFAYHFHALPLAVHTLDTNEKVPHSLFAKEHEEIRSMGYKLVTELVPSSDMVEGLVSTVEYNDTQAVVLGYPLEDTVGEFSHLLQTVVQHVFCPVIVVRFYGELHTERILVPLTDITDLADLYQIIVALDTIGEHRIHLLYLSSSTAEANDLMVKEREIKDWLKLQPIHIKASIKAVATQARVATVVEAAAEADLVVMGTPYLHGIHRFLFGSLADSIARKLQKTFIVVYNADKKNNNEGHNDERK